MSRRLGFAVALLLPLVLGAVVAAGENPDHIATPYDVDLRGQIPEVKRSPGVQSALAASQAWRDFQSRNQGWVARWNEGRAVPERAQGPAIALAEAPRDPRHAGNLARRFLGEQAGAWVDPQELDLVKAVPDRNGWWVQFSQEHKGVRVVGGRAYIRADRAGGVALFGADTHPKLDLDVTPRISEAVAMGTALSGFPHPADMELRDSELVILPLDRGTHTEYRLAYEISVDAAEPAGAWRSYVDAADGSLLWRHSLVRHGAVTGTVSGNVEIIQPGPQTQRSFEDLQTRLLSGSTAVDSSLTGTNGAYALTSPGPGDFTLEIPLSGPYGQVINRSNNNETPVLSIPVSVDEDLVQTVLLDDTTTRVQDRDAFYWTMQSRDYIRGVENDFSLLDYPMPIRTDLPNQECNAFWDGLAINFFPQSGNCANTARISSVVIHEYGHGITDFQYRPFAPSGAMHEGFSDYFAASLHNDPVVGRGFFLAPNSSIREIATDRVWPTDLVDEVHIDGLIIAGALWDVREVLGRETADELWHFACYGFADNFHDYFFDYLITDDDDGNVYNGTPNFDVIVEAFRRHGIGDYSIQVSHEPEPDTESSSKVFDLAANFLSVFSLDESTVQVHLEFDRNGQVTSETRDMAPASGVREFSTTIETQAQGTVVRYWFTASDTAGTSVTHPATGAEDPFVFRIGVDTESPEIRHEVLPDQPSETSSIRVVAHVMDNLDIDVPVVNLVYSFNGGDETTMPLALQGYYAYEGMLPAESLAAGDGFAYRIEVSDGAAVPNQAMSPETGMHEFSVVRGLGRDFELDDGGLTASGDWAWGSAEPLQSAYSGEKLWATVPTGAYSNELVSDLVLGPVDLTGWTRAGLFFQHVYDIEPFWDGGHVEASSDGGQTWTLLTPDGQYPWAGIFSTNRPGYSAEIEDWEPAAFDMTAFLGHADVRVRLRFASDSGLAMFGWHVDDLQLAERQVLASPLGLAGKEGRDSSVPLAWSTPGGINPTDPNSTFLGYHVYRSTGKGAFVQLTTEPLATPAYSDDTAENGTSYDYQVTSVYADGESVPTAAVQAMPFVSTLTTSVESIDATVEPGETQVFEFPVENTGTGFLRMNFGAMGEDQEPDDVRIDYDIASRVGAGALPPASADPRVVPLQTTIAPSKTLASDGEPGDSSGSGDWSSLRDGLFAMSGRVKSTTQPAAIPPTGEWETLNIDGADQPSPAMPDIATVSAQVSNGSLYLRITSFKQWGSIESAFTLAMAMDTDFNLDTGGSFGEYAIIAGALPSQFAGTPVLIVDSNFNVVGVPHHVVFGSNAQTAEFGVFLDQIDSPDRVSLAGAVLHPTNSNLILDRAPDAVQGLDWIQFESNFLEVFQGESGVQNVTLNSEGLAKGVYRAKLGVDTNDPAQRTITVPLVFEVDDDTAVSLLALTGQSTDLGVRLDWRTVSETDHAGFAVFRRDTPGGEEIRVSEGLLTSADGTYRFEDRAVLDGRDYEYRVADIDRTGHLTFHGPVVVRYLGAAQLTAPVLRQNLPNPFRAGTRVRFGVETSRPVTLRVYSVEGRLVRTLAAGEVFSRGFHEIPWDGTDDTGRPVSAGVYAYRLITPGDIQQKKMVLIR